MGMNFNNDHFYTHTFTPPEYQVELITKTKDRNTIICSSTSISKSFIAVKLIQEFAWQMRTAEGKRAICILDHQNIQLFSSHINLLTDVPVKTLDADITLSEWHKLRVDYLVFLMTAQVCVQLLTLLNADISSLNLIIIDDCFYDARQQHLESVMQIYDAQTGDRPRIIGLVSGFLGEDLKPMHLEAEMHRLEHLLQSHIDTSSELCTLVKLSCTPHECIIAYENRRLTNDDLVARLQREVDALKQFLIDHRYDLYTTYKDYPDLLAEVQHIPDPVLVPLDIIAQFQEVLAELGVLSAYYAAQHLLHQIDKMRVKVAHERHFLLLLTVQTLMIKVRALICDEIEELNEFRAMQTYSTGKVDRLIEVLKILGPSDQEKTETLKINDGSPKKEAKLANVKGRRNSRGFRRFNHRPQQEDNICALIFVKNSLTAKVVHSLLSTVALNDEKMCWLGVQFIVDKIADPTTQIREAELEHRRQEDVLRKFRGHECNILIATPSLEQGYDLPKCNLVVKLDMPGTFHSYMFTRARARTSSAHYVTLVHAAAASQALRKFAEFKHVQNVLLSRSNQVDGNTTNVIFTDLFCRQFKAYRTSDAPDAGQVTVNTAIQLINRYCAKLPSDAFTKLVPAFTITQKNWRFQCCLRLPINSPIKLTVVGPWAPSEIAAKQLTAFHMCQLLHKSNELDATLNPITKENFRAVEEDWNDFTLEKEDEELSKENVEHRPGTTKRRQYYFKQIAAALRDCLPRAEAPTFFYEIVMTLTCPIPEEQNTRGRRIYPPEESRQGFGVLTFREIPPVCPFPIFTRSGEVNVALHLRADSMILTQEQIGCIQEFQNYTFTSVLRLQKYQMHFDPTLSLSNYYVVPTVRDDECCSVDWEFLNLIFIKRYKLPTHIPDDERKDYVFDAHRYKDAVVMPWYRNQDQPQYFYVAEICNHLSPSSAFPGSEYNTFQDYYFKKYNIHIQNKVQYLLDVDHTSARLNFLTPRYVNRKGVALPTSSEETKRAKRENLEQKQILVPELCAIHPFPASLWRKAVCLPCILYRINALLLADQIRCIVAQEIALGCEKLERDFRWSSLNFGWNLADVLNKTKLTTKSNAPKLQQVTQILDDLIDKVVLQCNNTKDTNGKCSDDEDDENWMEIGTWSNDMLNNNGTEQEAAIRYGSPTIWMENSFNDFDSDSDSFISSNEEDDGDTMFGGLHIKFESEYQAEAVEDATIEQPPIVQNMQAWTNDVKLSLDEEHKFHQEVNACVERLRHQNYIPSNRSFFKVSENVKVPSNISQIAHLESKYEYEHNKTRDTPVQQTKIANTLNSDCTFSFDAQPDLSAHPGPNPSVILQALTMSNANDGINLERLETIGDSFLKYAITDYLYTRYENTHEGKLSHLRSKQVSNLNLYRLGKRKKLGMMMIASKFDPHDNWLPPCYCVSRELEEILSQSNIPHSYVTLADYVETRQMTLAELCTKFRSKAEADEECSIAGFIPYNLVTQHSIPDKSIADCVEALIGAYLIECGPRGALLFMAWLGIRVVPRLADGSYGDLNIPESPLLRHVDNPEGTLDVLLNGYARFENILGYAFHDRSYLLQALTHASYSPNTITDCYQRLEFLGDAVLDYLITRHLYEDQRMHSPGALTDLRSALVNNTIFASLAVKYEFHKYFRYLSPGLHQVIEKFIQMQEDAGHKVSDDLYLLDVEECEEVEDVEVPKVLGDIFESVAGAVFLDSGRSLDAVWTVYYKMMRNEIEQFSNKVPKSPIRELLELEPETAKFGRAEKLADGRRVRVSVEVFGKGTFKGIGRNYRIAKCTAAKCALKHLKKSLK